MGYYGVIEEVGSKLVDLIGNNLKGAIIETIIDPAEVTLSSPENKPGKLSLFLYQINENAYLRNQEELIDYSKIKFPPVSLSLFYLITVNTDDDHHNHIIMGRVLQIIHDNAILGGSNLPVGLDGDELRLILNPLSIDDLNKLWSIVSGSKPYKLSISVEVTPVRIDSTRDQAVKRVKERDLTFYQEKEGTNG
jgi:hypothetical protein